MPGWFALVPFAGDVGPDVARPDLRQAVDARPSASRCAGRLRSGSAVTCHRCPFQCSMPRQAVPSPPPPTHTSLGGTRSGRGAAERERSVPPASAVEVREVTRRAGRGRFAERPQLRRGRGDRGLDRGIEPDRRGPSACRSSAARRCSQPRRCHARRAPRRSSPRWPPPRPTPWSSGLLMYAPGRRHAPPRPAVPVPHDHGPVAGVTVTARRRSRRTRPRPARHPARCLPTARRR